MNCLTARGKNSALGSASRDATNKESPTTLKPFAAQHQNASRDAFDAAFKTNSTSLLAHYKYPRWSKSVDDLSETAVDRIQRFQLRASA